MSDLSIQKLRDKIEELEGVIQILLVENRYLRRQLYGSKGEKIRDEDPDKKSKPTDPVKDDNAPCKTDDPDADKEAAQTPPGDKPHKEPKSKTPNNPNGGRKNSKKNRAKLRTQDIIHDILACSHCDSTRLTSTGTEIISEEIEYIPAHLLLRKHHCLRKRCLDCDKMVVGQGPQRVTENGDYGPGLHAYIAVSKCADSMPLHRLARQFQRYGVDLGRSTLGDIFHRTAKLLRPIFDRICEVVKAAFYVGADETPLNLWAPNQCKRGYIWTFHCSEAIIYLFEDTRSGDVPKNFLSNTTGILTADAYSGYNPVCTPEGRKRSGCLAHLRRKFYDSLGTEKDDAMSGMLMIRKLYMVEHDAASQDILGTDAHLAMRQQTSSVVMQALKEACLKWQSHPPKSPMGKAVTYAQNQWKQLCMFLSDAKIRLDNNLSENALRIIAIGRKNFMFVGTKQAGQNLAILQSIISTCKIHGVNPQTYISSVLIRMHTTPMSQIDSLLPMNWVPDPA